MISSLSQVSLREVSEENVSAICNLSVRQEQTAYVVSTAIAIAEAAYSKNDRLQAIYADEIPVGLAVTRMEAENSSYFLWRLMIDARYQGLKFGSRSIDLLTKQVKEDHNFDEFLTSVISGDFSPLKFYARRGFKLTGKTYEGEAVMRLALGPKT